MSEQERLEIDSTFAFHSAPTLLGVKCANLISFNMNESTMSEYLCEFTDKLSGSGLCAKQLCKCRKRTLVYIYNEKMLDAWLKMPQVREFLSEYGYTADITISEMLDKLADRMNCESFPHEIGVFLGYPLADIKGFISNSGKKCLLCGYWKVYENAEKAKQTFEIYDRCRDTLFDRLNHGMNLFQAVK